MDGKAMAIKRAEAMNRIEAAIVLMTEKLGVDKRVAEELRKKYADPQIADLRRLEVLADLVETLAALALKKQADASKAADQVAVMADALVSSKKGKG